MKEIESPLSDEIPSNLQQSDEDQKSPSAFPSFSTDKDKLSLGENIFIKSVNHIIQTKYLYAITTLMKPFSFIGRAILYNCKLSSDQRFLIFDCHESVASSPAITPTHTDAENPKNNGDKSLGINVIRPIDLSKITDAETHNAEKQGKIQN